MVIDFCLLSCNVSLQRKEKCDPVSNITFKSLEGYFKNKFHRIVGMAHNFFNFFLVKH